MAIGDRLKWDNPRGPKWFRALIDNVFLQITQRQPLPGLGLDASETAHGVQLSLLTSSGRGGKTVLKLQLFDATDVDGPGVGITFGTVAGLVPTGWFAYLAAPLTADNPFILQPVGTGTAGEFGFVWATVTVTDPFTLAVPATLIFDSGTGSPADTATEVHLILGTYHIADDGKSVLVNSALSGSQALVVVVNEDDTSPYLEAFWSVV